MRTPHPFGELLGKLRARKPGLTQTKLAELSGYDPAVIARMGQGQKDLTGPLARERILRVVQALDEAGVLNGVDEANALLQAATLPPLFAGNYAEAELMQQLALHRRAAPDGVLSAPSAPRHNLPAQLTSFIGREQEIAQVQLFLAAPPSKNLTARNRSDARLVTLTGPGGVGKTRLALEIAAALCEDFADGAWWVPLAALNDSSLVAQAILSTFELNRHSAGAPQSVLVDYFQKRRLLLVLDNCEHLVDACADLAAHLMSHCPNLRILATSREALQVPGELALRVPPLAAPRTAITDTADALSFDAVQLFVERAQAMRPEFALTADNADAVVHVCDRLDGIPLALELAAALLQAMSVEEIASRIDNRFALLKGGFRTVPVRHQALSNAVDWSYELLTPAEQILLARLSVFAGGWNAEAAEGICADAELKRADILPTLRQLVNKSLVVIDEKTAESSRYRLLKTIHEYATQKLRERSEHTMLKDSHLEYLVSLAETADAQFCTKQHAAALQRLVEQQDELRTALNHAEQSKNANALLRLAMALQWFWRFRGAREEGTLWRDKALALDEAAPTKLRLALLFAWAGTFNLSEVPQLTQIMPIVNICLEACRASQDQVGIAQALTVLGTYAIAEQKDFAQARMYLDEALHLFEAMGDSRAIAGVRHKIGYVLHGQGDLAGLGAWQQQSIALFRDTGNYFDLAHEFAELAWQTEHAGGDRKQIVELWREALQAMQVAGDPSYIGDLKRVLGYAELEAGDRAQAADHFAQALAEACANDNKLFIRWAMIPLCNADSARALPLIQGYLLSKQQAGDKQGIAAGSYFLGMVHQDGDTHDYEQARQLLEQSLALWRELGIVTAQYGGLVLNLSDLGQAHHFLGDQRRAIQCFDEAIHLAEEAQDGEHQLGATLYRGHARLALGELDFAEADFRNAMNEGDGFKKERPFMALAGLGEVAARRGHAELSAKLMGCAATKADDIRKHGSHTWSHDYLQLLAAAHERINDPVFVAGWAVGQKLSLDEAKQLQI